MLRVYAAGLANNTLPNVNLSKLDSILVETDKLCILKARPNS
jgi:hypothetical protein